MVRRPLAGKRASRVVVSMIFELRCDLLSNSVFFFSIVYFKVETFQVIC